MKRACLGLMMALAVMILSACTRPETTPMPSSAAVLTSVAKGPASSPTPPTPVPQALTPSTALAAPTPIPPTLPPAPTPAPFPADWPMFRFSPDRAGYNPTESVLRPPLELKWQFDAKGEI